MTIEVSNEMAPRKILAEGGGYVYYKYWHCDRFVMTQGSITNPPLVVEFWGHFFAFDGAGGKVHDKEITTHCKVHDVEAFIAAIKSQEDPLAADAVTRGVLMALCADPNSTATEMVTIALQAAMAETLNSQYPQYGRSFALVAPVA